jgi:MFS family permease
VVGLGVGAGAYYNPATALLTRAFDGSGGAIGTHRSGGQVAGVFALVAAAVLAIRYGWRPTIAVGGVLVAVVAGLFLWRSTASESVHPDASLAVVFDPGTFRGVLSRPHARNTTILMTLVEFAELAAMAFFPTFLVEHYGFALGDANLLFAAFFTVSALSQPLGGWLSDRAGRDATATVQAAAGVAGFGLLAAGGSAVAAVPGVALAGVSMSGTPVFQSRMMDGLDAADRGTGFGVFRTVYLLLGASGTAVVGTVADLVGWGVSFGLLAALFGLVLPSLLALGAAGLTDRSLPLVR